MTASLTEGPNQVGYRHIPGFTNPEEVATFEDLLQAHASLFKPVLAKAGLGPSYLVIGGDQIREHLPQLVRFGQERVKPVVEELAGRELREMDSLKRSIRVQLYTKPEHGLRWHADGNSYAALLTIRNTNRGATQFIPPRLSSLLLLLRYPLYPWPAVFSVFPHDSVVSQAGDLLVLHGGRLLHRGVNRDQEGERLIVVYGYDEPDKPRNPVKNRIVEWLNF